MPIRDAKAVWEGDLLKGTGTMEFGSGSFKGNYGFGSRFENGAGTNPEELIGAAHAGCFSMAFSGTLGRAGFTAKRIETKAKVYIEKVGEGFKITKIELNMRGEVPGIDQATFLKHAESAKAGCPVSQALTGTEVHLKAELIS